MHLGGQHGPQNPPKILPKSTQNRSKIDIKIDENLCQKIKVMSCPAMPQSRNRGGGEGFIPHVMMGPPRGPKMVVPK